MSLLTISNQLLWLALLAMGVVVLALARQIGALHERLTPMGALMMDAGRKVGEAAPHMTLTGIDGHVVGIGGPAPRNTLLFFLSPECPVCKKLTPMLRSLQSAERDILDVVLASDGPVEEHRDFYKRANLAPMPYVLSTELGMEFQIAKLPYAILIDQGGVIRAKGLVNSREHLESLLTARELGVSSAQEFRRQQAAIGRTIGRTVGGANASG